MFDKDRLAQILKDIQGLSADPLNHPVKGKTRGQIYSDAPTEDLEVRLRESLWALSDLLNQAKNIMFPGGTPENDDPNDYEVARHPIFISDTDVVLITVLHTTDSLNHLFIRDYIDYRKQQKIAAKDLIKQISPICSINMLWALKEAIDEEITEHNTRCGSNHPLNRVQKET